MAPATRSATSEATLEVQWAPSEAMERLGTYLSHIRQAVDNLDIIIGLARGIAVEYALDDEPGSRASAFSNRALRLQFGSPLVIETELAREILESTPAIAFLAYALKRAWGFDLELLTYREELRHRFLEAKKKAREAEQQLEQEEREPEQVEDEQGWGSRSIRATRLPMLPSGKWRGGNATMRVEDD